MKDPHKAEEALAMILIALFGASIIGLLGAIVLSVKALFQ